MAIAGVAPSKSIVPIPTLASLYFLVEPFYQATPLLQSRQFHCAVPPLGRQGAAFREPVAPSLFGDGVTGKRAESFRRTRRLEESPLCS